jgi:hypothetical protein
MMMAMMGDSRPTVALSVISGKPVTPASVTIGVASATNATGAVLPTKHRPAAVNAGMPSAASSDAETATGVPNPDVPPMNAPKENAMSSTSMRWSPLTRLSDRPMATNDPDSTATLNSRIAE